MRIDELKRIAKENGYKLIDGIFVVYIFGYSHGNTNEFKTEIWINKARVKDITIETGIYCEEEEFNMIKASIEFAETPLEDREEEKKFYLKHKYFKCIDGNIRYFQIYKPNGNPWLNVMDSTMEYKKQFTLKEIEEIKEKFDTDLADFELVEAEE